MRASVCLCGGGDELAALVDHANLALSGRSVFSVRVRVSVSKRLVSTKIPICSLGKGECLRVLLAASAAGTNFSVPMSSRLVLYARFKHSIAPAGGVGVGGVFPALFEKRRLRCS